MIGDLSSPSRVGELSLPAASTSPSAARAFAAKHLTEWGYDDDGDVLLAVSELVTNALLHARTSMTVRLADEGDGVVLLSVADGSVAPPRGRRFTVESGTGRGLRLLDSLALEWGVEPSDGGKTVWARIATGGDPAGFGEFDVDAVEAW